MEEISQVTGEKLAYRGKQFTLPSLSAEGIRLVPQPGDHYTLPPASPILKDMNTVWNLERFQTARAPIITEKLTAEELAVFSQRGVPRVLDLPIKFPGSDFRIPKELAQFVPTIQKIADYEAVINSTCFDEYYAYLTIDQGFVYPGQLQREAPCHVDGFQGQRWKPKVRINHTYTVGDVLPTTLYVQPFDFSRLDEKVHDFFWEMNRQVNQTNSLYAWRPETGDITLMDAYSVHRGSEAEVETWRTWLRLSFEVRIFDRLGNAHNPMFAYDWEMVPRDIESLALVAFDPGSDESLRVFPHEQIAGQRYERPKDKTQPKLRTGFTAETVTFPEMAIDLTDPHWAYPEELRHYHGGG